ncbi:GDSL esterase/lipase [Quillaja saponaria]|uniref:GDSL esterase/lipase n=1 Tax=Quillaja saponaria TaxID=32244 RepID=A0AAD7LAV0_QUISA|nr:GDSL esterase/lipase [Quillaja saponaria]
MLRVINSQISSRNNVNMSLMIEKLSIVFCCIFLLLSCLSPMLVMCVKSSPPTPWPGLYAFGDSILDTGNDYFPGMSMIANYSPYEIDFPTGLYCLDCGAEPFGRYTNGYTIPDFLGEFLLQNSFVLPFTYHSEQAMFLKSGYSFASGSASILPETTLSKLGKIACFEKQIEAFTDYVTRFLPKSIDERSVHLSNSIFLVHIGSDDYLYNYLQKDGINNKYSARQFGKLLVEKLGNHLKHLYHEGARKIVVFEIPPLGCLPREQVDYIPAPNTGGCTRSTNNLVHHFNKQLPGLLNSLSRSLKGVTFVTAKTYGLFLDMASNPNKYGLTDTRNPCCILASSGSGLCEPYQKPCDNRNSHLFWDSINPTEVVHKLIAEKCYKGSGLCVPINISNLVML